MGEAIDAGNVKKVSQLLQNDYNSKMEDKQKLENALKNPTAPENRKIVEGKNLQVRVRLCPGTALIFLNLTAHCPAPGTTYNMLHIETLSFSKAAED